MTIEVSSVVEEQIRDLAARQGRAVDALVNDAILSYLDMASLSDLRPADIAESQLAMLGELEDIPEWEDG